MDTGLSREDTEMLKTIARDTDGVRDVHELRSRRMGHDILLDIHLVVRPEISVSEGHQIGMRVVAGMRDALDNIRSINFHIDAENDEDQPVTSERLPSREDIRSILAAQLGALPHHSRLRLHYLKNRVHLELFLEEPEADTPFNAANIKARLGDYPWFGSVRVWVAGP